MNDKLTEYLNNIFAPYNGLKSVSELKSDLFTDLQEKFSELKVEGKDDETAFKMTIDSIGDIEKTIQDIANLSRSLEHKVVTNFSNSNLSNSDFAGVTAHKGKFEGSALLDSDFSGADLTGSSFKSSDVRKANFNSTNLTDCNFSTLDLTDASFYQSTLVRTNFDKTCLTGAKFINVNLIDVKLTMIDLRKTVFENCVFDGVNFKSSDLTGLCLDGHTFIGVKFDKAGLKKVSFKGATFKNVSFPVSIIFKKYYRAVKTICFDGAKMDKLTYASLKGMGADLSKVTVI